jgi:hypothetical protein
MPPQGALQVGSTRQEDASSSALPFVDVLLRQRQNYCIDNERMCHMPEKQLFITNPYGIVCHHTPPSQPLKHYT